MNWIITILATVWTIDVTHEAWRKKMRPKPPHPGNFYATAVAMDDMRAAQIERLAKYHRDTLDYYADDLCDRLNISTECDSPQRDAVLDFVDGGRTWEETKAEVASWRTC